MSSRQRPEYLGQVHAERFQDQSVVDTYHLRPPYPAEIFATLLSLLPGNARAVLDVGCGTGDIARGLVEQVERVDALDFSRPMLEKGQTLPNGKHERLHWIYGTAEETPLNPPYGLITAGQSLHWMDWDIVLPRFREMLVPPGMLAIVEVEGASGWSNNLMDIIKRYSTNPHFQSFDLVAELEKRQLFEKIGEQKTPPVYFSQSLEDFIAACHSRSSLSREHMGAEAAAAFDQEVRDICLPHLTNEVLGSDVYGTIAWGKPL